jgi:hypothetical protein
MSQLEREDRLVRQEQQVQQVRLALLDRMEQRARRDPLVEVVEQRARRDPLVEVVEQRVRQDPLG